MKNLNRKLSVIALSGMAVFGGVAASGVQAFAAGNGVVVQQQAQDKVAEDLQELIVEVGFDNIYKAVKSSANRKQLLDEAQEIAKANGSRYFNRGSRSVNQKNPKKSLQKLLQSRQDAIVLKFEGKYVLLVDIAH